MDNYQQDIFQAYSLINEAKKPKKDEDLPAMNDKKGSKNTKLDKTATGPNGKMKPVKAGEKGKFSEGVEKNAKRPLNNFMSKSAFDKLFEQAMTDDEALGLPPAGDSGDPLPDEGMPGGLEDDTVEGEDSVTFTLDRATAQALHSALASILDTEAVADETEETFGDDGEDFGEGDEMVDGEGSFGEGVDIKELGDKGSQMTKPGHKEVKGAVPVSKGKANGAVTGPSDLKAGKTGYNDGKSNKVSKLKQGSEFFDA